MAALERTYNIPLRKEFLKVPRYKRAKKAVTAVREFLARHMKAEKVLLGSHLNQMIWKRGIKNPPHHVNVSAVKDDKGTVRAELIGAPKAKPKKIKAWQKAAEAKKEDIKQDTADLKEALAGELQKQEEPAEITIERSPDSPEPPKAKPKKANKAKEKAE